jgi:hypothetical protein
MTKIEFKKASRPLSEYATKARKDPVVVYKAGKPFAAVIPIRNADEETLALSTNRKFLRIITRSRARAKKADTISAGDCAGVSAWLNSARLLRSSDIKTCKSRGRPRTTSHLAVPVV